jgi:hypothetical protein|mmetsp:Transcript_11574/g.15661  ORF Transcript_11574/g.15661 Transcript_11574/m.15661 type:complete len:87 (-) Transcript_11574:207-467(-)
MVDMSSEARLGGLARLLTFHVSCQILDCLSRLLTVRFALKVDKDELAGFDLGVCEEKLEEGLDSTFARLQEAWLHVTPELLLREGW